MKKFTLAIITLISILLVPTPPTLAATATANLSVSVEVDSSCEITATPVVFPAYSPVATQSDNSSAGSVTLVCTTGTSSTVGLGLGSNSSGNQARLANSGNFINYTLYQDANHNSVWGDSNPTWMTVAAAPSLSPRTYTVYGRIPTGQDVPSGTYTDTVIATVNF